MNWIKHPLELRHLGVLSDASKMISEPMVCLAQTMHLSCTDINTIFKWTKTRFHLTHVTLEFRRVRPKWFMSLWCVWHKPCTYLSSRLVLSPNGLNQAFTWAPLEPHHLGVPSGASKIISEPMVRSTQTRHLSCTDTNIIPKWAETRFHRTHVCWR
jgi:hypothetical protein